MTALPALTIERTDLALPAADLESAATFARNEKAPATRAAYRADFDLFRTWCDAKGVKALPASPETVAAFLAHEAEQGSAASTTTRRCASIRYAHRLAEFEPPTNSERVQASCEASAAPSGPPRPAKPPSPARRMYCTCRLVKRRAGRLWRQA